MKDDVDPTIICRYPAEQRPRAKDCEDENGIKSTLGRIIIILTYFWPATIGSVCYTV